jgi:hypothetical protein
MHRHRTRVSCFSEKSGQNSALTGYRRHYANGRVNGLQIRPLLDVDFDIRSRFSGPQCRVGQCAGIAAERPYRLAQSYPVGVNDIEERRVKGTGQRAASQVRGLEAESFFVGERDHFNREGWGPLSFAGLVDNFDGHEDPERAIVAAGVAHAIEMTTEEKSWRARL